MSPSPQPLTSSDLQSGLSFLSGASEVVTSSVGA